MDFFRERKPLKVFFLMTMTVLCFRPAYVKGQEYTFTMPIDSMKMYHGPHEPSKSSMATLCVEIKPNGPKEEPYYMCRGADFPPFPKVPFGNTDSESKSVALPYAENGHLGNTNNNRRNGDSGSFFQGFSDKYGSLNSANKDSSPHNEPQMSPYQQFISPHGSGSSSSSNTPSKISNSGKPESFHPQSLPAGYRPSEQFQPQNPSEYQQQQQFSSQPHQAKQQQQFRSEHQAPRFYLSKTFFRPPSEAKRNEPAENVQRYDSNEQTGKHTSSSPYNAQHSSTFGTELALPVYKTQAAGISPYTPLSNGYEASQRGTNIPECGENCGKPASKPTVAGGAPYGATYSEQYPGNKAVHGGYEEQNVGKSHTHNGAGSYANKPAVPSVSTADIKVPVSFQEVSNVATESARPSHPPPFRFPVHATAQITPNERSEQSVMAGTDVPKLSPHHIRNKSKFLNDGLRSAPSGQVLHPQTMHAQLQERLSHNQPTSNRYRAMIDDEVLKMPNWEFTPDEFDLYRSAPSLLEVKPNFGLASIYSHPRMIPLDYLEDPVMRAFYSSLPDVGPLPIVRPPLTFSYPSKQSHQVASCSQQSTQRMLYQQPFDCPNSYQRNPQFFNYNPCPPPHEYNVQPVFIAIPCYGQPMYQAMMTPPVGGHLGMPAPKVDYDQLGMMNPFANPLSRILTIGNPVAHLLTSSHTPSTPTAMLQTETPANNNRKEVKELRTKTMPTTTVTTSIDIDSKESAESVEEISEQKLLKASKNNNLKVSDEESLGSTELKEATSVKPEDANVGTNLSETIQSTTNRASVEVISSPQQVTTMSSINHSSRDEDVEDQSRTTFRSLIATARRLAGMVHTHDDESIYNLDSSTPAPNSKKQRQASKANGGGKRKFMQQM